MSDPRDDLDRVDAATQELLTAVGRLDAPALTEPCQLPGWTRGHLLAHVSRNADALDRVLRGEPMYASAEARDADIEAGAGRGPAEQLDDLRASADRLSATARALGDPDWEREVELRGGVRDLAARIPFRRLAEVEIHHVDLDVGRGFRDLPAAFVERQVDVMARRFLGNPDVPGLELRADSGNHWRSGVERGEPLVVTGDPVDLLAWLMGRSTGSGLTADGELPALPKF
ncbi:maleylpyruvate isomerase family mycothiol-dependent enzyme [Streptomyces sp. NPDC005438]|uniref:maleylpyruvate isomerase family mycothiol-dependent enzyme n=1 Tax=Streptomyces sp. NPDC005438 TaxID=3156880 RepID=UPI0033B5AED6